MVVMGRYYAMVHGFVLEDLKKTRGDLTADQQDRLARQFAAAYCNATYRSADMIERTIRDEGFDCDYVRSGWITAVDRESQDALDKAVAAFTKIGKKYDILHKTKEQIIAKYGE